MAMPTFQLLLDDASNSSTFPYDITSFVRLTDPVEVTRGRGNEFDEIQPSTFNATLENTDGRFTLGSTSGGYGAINVDRRIRYKVTANGVTTTRFTGFVQTWPVEWPDGGDTFAVAKITAVDRLARMARKTLRSIIEEEILLDSPIGYWTLGEPAGSTQAFDTSEASPSVGPLTTQGSGSAVTFGTATGPGTDGLTAAQFNGGEYLGSTPVILPSSLAYSAYEAFFIVPTPPPSGQTMYLLDAQHLVWVTSAGLISVGVFPDTALVTSSTSVADGHLHHFCVSATAFNVTTFFVDGVSVGTFTDSGGWLGGVRVGGPSPVGGDVALTGVMAHVALLKFGISASRAASHATAGFTGFAGERSDQRFSRLAAYGGASPNPETGINTSVPFVDITGASPISAITDVDKAEGGTAFIRGDDTLVMQNRSHRALQVTPDLTMTNNEVDPASTVVADMQLVENIVTVSAAPEGGVQIATNSASRATHGDYPVDLGGLLIGSDEQALNAALWRVGKYAEPFLRMPDLSFDLTTLTAAQQASVMALEISDHIQITGMPSQAGATTLDLLVEGWSESLSADSWTWQANTSNWSTATAWILGDATYGVLGSTTVLGY